jgi:hypothetical protein
MLRALRRFSLSPNRQLAPDIQLREYSVEQPDMRGVKALMIGRLSLTWLWPILCLIALPNAQARGLRPAENIPAAIVEASSLQDQASQDFGIHFRSTRSARRFDSEIPSDDTALALWSFQIESVRGDNTLCFPLDSEACLSLASSWQFLWRTALSPRAPSSVS